MSDHDHVGEQHRSHRSGWLRAGVLGANDGLLSTASLLIGVAAGNASRSVLVLTAVAALVAGALSMAVGEYSSVASQRDAELADLQMERRSLASDPDEELLELAELYRKKGLTQQLSMEVAQQLSAIDAFAAHSRDELGLDPDALTSPIQASLSSALSFSLGAAVPALTMGLASSGVRIPGTVGLTLVALGVLGGIGARLGGASVTRAAVRLVLLGGGSMVVTTLVGRLLGTSV